MSDLNNTILNQLLSQQSTMLTAIGGITAQLQAGAEKHREFTEKLDMIDRRTDICEDHAIAAEGKMDAIDQRTTKIEATLVPPDNAKKPLVDRIKELEDFKGRVAAILIGGWAAVTAVLYFLLSGFMWLFAHWAEIKSSFANLFTSR